MEDAYSWQLHSPAALEAPEAAAAPRLKWRGVSTARPGRSEAHVWISGRQVYLGSFVEPSHAAMAYDLASVHLRGETAVTNHPLDWYAAELEERDPVRGVVPGYWGRDGPSTDASMGRQTCLPDSSIPCMP